MYSSSLVFAVLCAVGLSMYGVSAQNQEAIVKCTEKMTEVMTKLMTDVQSGKANMNEMKDKVCPAMKDFTKCILKEPFDAKPTQAQLDKLKKDIKQKMDQSPQKIDCGMDIDAMADEAWNSAGVARPLSLLAVAVTALGALFVTRRF